MPNINPSEILGTNRPASQLPDAIPPHNVPNRSNGFHGFYSFGGQQLRAHIDGRDARIELGGEAEHGVLVIRDQDGKAKFIVDGKDGSVLQSGDLEIKGKLTVEEHSVVKTLDIERLNVSEIAISDLARIIGDLKVEGKLTTRELEVTGPARIPNLDLTGVEVLKLARLEASEQIITHDLVVNGTAHLAEIDLPQRLRLIALHVDGTTTSQNLTVKDSTATSRLVATHEAILEQVIVNGDATVAGKITTTDLEVTGSAHISGLTLGDVEELSLDRLQVAEQARVKDLTVTGSANISGLTLADVEELSLERLAVTEQAQIKDLTVTGSANISGLTLGDVEELSLDRLEVTEHTQTKDLTVTGVAKLSGVDLTELETVELTQLDVTNATINQTLTVGSNAEIEGDLKVKGTTETTNLKVTGQAEIANLEFDGAMTFEDVTVNDQLLVKGTTISKDLKVDGQVKGNLDIGGTTSTQSLTAQETVSSRRVAVSDTVMTKDLMVNGRVRQNLHVEGRLVTDDLTTHNLVATKDLTVNGEVRGNLTIDGTTKTDGLNVEGLATLQGLAVNSITTTQDLQVNGQVRNNLAVESMATANDLTIKNLTTTKDLRVNGQVKGKLVVEGYTTTDNLSVDRTTVTKHLKVHGSAEIPNLTLTGQTTVETLLVEKDLTVKGEANLEGDLNVAGRTYTGDLVVNNEAGEKMIELNAASGHINFCQAADCAEDFDVVEDEAIEPGMVMVLNERGQLQRSGTAYDKRVAGVISGAGGYRPGIILDQQADTTSRRMPIALMGKVFCKVDANAAPVEVGDMLTTSETPGCAMKAGDPARAFGAVIGKALQPLAQGVDLIPILIALQ